MAVSANKLELLQIADAVAREKQIDRQIVIEAMEDAIQKAARARYGMETEIRAEINPKSGETRLQRLMEVVETVENPSTQIAIHDALARYARIISFAACGVASRPMKRSALRERIDMRGKPSHTVGRGAKSGGSWMASTS